MMLLANQRIEIASLLILGASYYTCGSEVLHVRTNLHYGAMAQLGNAGMDFGGNHTTINGKIALYPIGEDFHVCGPTSGGFSLLSSSSSSLCGVCDTTTRSVLELFYCGIQIISLGNSDGASVFLLNE